MIRHALVALAITAAWISVANANHNKPRPNADPPAGYEHDKWGTKPVDIGKTYEGFVVSFDGKDDDDGDGEMDLWRVPHWVAMHIKKTDEDCIDTGKRPNHWFADPGLLATGVAARHDSYAFSQDFRSLHPESSRPSLLTQLTPITGAERARHILRAKRLEISLCRGTASVAPVEGFVQSECARPSRLS